jgi:RimJ/RimL family protein N-acetyltransferase
MSVATSLETKNLRLVPRTREQVQASLLQMPAHQKAEVSPAWLARLEGSGPIDPWIHGFVIERRETGTVIGMCGFKGPPDAAGVVEIAYGVSPEHEGKGYATEAAGALVNYAFGHEQVSVVCAHTLPQANASTRVLTKCNFRKIGEVIDPEDGLVWRWERTVE